MLPFIHYYFENTGRIVNRFSSDVYGIDDSLPFIMNILFAQVIHPAPPCQLSSLLIFLFLPPSPPDGGLVGNAGHHLLWAAVLYGGVGASGGGVLLCAAVLPPNVARGQAALVYLKVSRVCPFFRNAHGPHVCARTSRGAPLC